MSCDQKCVESFERVSFARIFLDKADHVNLPRKYDIVFNHSFCLKTEDLI